MATVTGTETDEDAALVDPRAPRFGQSITATLLAVGIALQEPFAVYTVAAILGASAASGWRVDLYGELWTALLPVVGRPEEREPAAPHRFAKLMGAVGTVLASALLLAGLPLAGYVVAAGVAIPAGLAAATDVCIGCRLYRHVGAAQRLGVV